MNLREGLETSATGRLSSVLIPPHNLSKILKEVILKLPQDVSLIVGFNVESMYIYYDVATVQAYATTAIQLVVRLPLRGADRVMTLFKSVSLPTYSEVLARHIQIEPEAPYLVVTENGQYYSLLTTADLQQCKQGWFAICDTTFPFIHKTQASCSSTLYFGQTEVAHTTCQKFILNENFSPVWLVAKGIHPLWIYSLPSTMMIAKKCKVNGTTRNFTMELSHTGILIEDTRCQFYSEVFILLPVTDGYTNVSLTGSQVLPPHLPELISPQEHDQITHEETRIRQTLATLETIARRSSSANQRSYVQLRDLLTTTSHEGVTTNRHTWVYALVILSCILSFAALISRYWQRPVITLTRTILPCRTDQRLNDSQEMSSRPIPTTMATTPDMTDCPCCIDDIDEAMGVAISHPATPLQMEVEPVSKPAPIVPLQMEGGVHFAQPGKIQLRK
jgi:hypothetical protein